jgi:preprotein translocase subunit SecG
MSTLQQVVLGLHTLIAILIIALVLLQRGKGADAGAAFGAGASGTVFGARGSGSFFSRMTAVFATMFFVSSLSLAYLSSQQVDTGPASLLDEPAAEETVEPVPDDVPEAGDGLPALPPVDDALDVPADAPSGDADDEATVEPAADEPAADSLPEVPEEADTGE